jgi:hypothetical protein
MKLKSTFQVSRLSWMLLNKRYQDQRTKGEGRATILAKRRSILLRHNIW